MKKPHFGLVVGKFSPLHKGHQSLIEYAQNNCEVLAIISYSQPEFIGNESVIRKKWLEQLFPNAKIQVIPPAACPHNEASDDIHRQFVLELCMKYFHAIPDTVFANEDYGPGFAEHLSRVSGKEVYHKAADLNRSLWPISGTMIRSNVHDHRDYLSPIVYADFVQTVCFLGGESTGKSTLSEKAAKLFNTNWVKEYGRTLWEEKGGNLEFDASPK